MEPTQSELIRNVQERISEMESCLKHDYLHLPEQALTKRPAAGSWSIGETAAHTRLVMEIYLANIKDALRAHGPSVQDKPYRMGFNGRLMVKIMAPKKNRIRYKMPTLGSMEPQNEQNDTASERLHDLVITLKNFRNLTADCSRYDLNRVKVSSALGRIIRFRLGDALQLLQAHNDRHLVQIQNVCAIVSPAHYTHSMEREQARH